MTDPPAQLLEEREFLLRSLRDLDAEFAAGELDPADYHTLRDDYTVRAAAVLRRIEAGEDQQQPAGDAADDAADPATPADPAAHVRSRRLRSVVAGVAIAACAGGIGYAVAASSGTRTAADEATGSIPLTTTDRITRAQLLVNEGKVLEAIKAYDDLLGDDPDNPVALAQRGWLVSRVDQSLVDSGLASIDRAIAVDPSYAEARFFRGMILWRAKGLPAAAADEFQLAIDANPSPEVRGYLEDARRQALAAAATTTTSP